MRRIVFTLVFPLIGCGYDFSKFDRQAPNDSSAAIDSTLVDSTTNEAAEDSGAAADTFEASTPQDTSGIGDVAAWPDAAGVCKEYVDTSKTPSRTYVICSPAEGTTPFTLARTYCKTHGLDIAYIDDEETNTFLYQALIDAGGVGYKAWIGLKFSETSDDAAIDGGPYWLNHEPMTYTNWHVDSPGTNGLSWSSNCGDIYGGDGEWRDYTCDYQSFWFICGPP